MQRKLLPKTVGGLASDTPDGVSENCLTRRCDWFSGIFYCLVGIVSLMAIVGFVLSITDYVLANHSLTQNVVTLTGVMPSRPLNHVLTGAVPVIYYLPNDLTSFVGGLYSVDCLTAVGHSVVINPGSLDTNFGSGTARTATCTGPAPAGFTFRVLAPSRIRVVASTGVTFT